MTKKSNSASSVEKFPMKLHKIVERCEIDGYANIISWMPHGRSFKIHKRDEFVSKIMPRYFYITKFTSFIRQLTLYGFYKCRKGADKGSFFHKLFLRGRPGLCLDITRSSGKKRKLESEPNFYKMPYLPIIETSHDKVSDIPDRPRTVQYQTTSDANTSEATSTTETNINLSDPNNAQKSSSFEYFHKSQQLIAKTLFSIFGEENDTNHNINQEYNSTYPCAA